MVRKTDKVCKKLVSEQRFYEGLIGELPENGVFVFGSNPEGRHGAGTARIALLKFGAIYGQGRGLQGKSYGLVTKNLTPKYVEKSTGILYHRHGRCSLSREMIWDNIKELYDFALDNLDKDFYIAFTISEMALLNGYRSEDMAQMFINADDGNIPDNIIFSDTYKVKFRKKWNYKFTKKALDK